MSLKPAPLAPTDFDFIIGDWHVNHRRLNARLAGCTEWTAFSGQSSTAKILGGFGNIEDNILNFPNGVVRAVAIRSFDGGTGTWSIWWLDGKPIKVRFLWNANPEMNPTWEQAFSGDDGRTWETNWTMEFVRTEY